MASPWASVAPPLLVLLAAVTVGRPAVAAECFEGISGETAQKVFDALAGARPGDGCTLENVTTEQAQMRVEWKKGGVLQEAILVLPRSCAKGPVAPSSVSTAGKPAGAGSKLAAMVPPSVESACPAAADATKALVAEASLGDLVPLSQPLSIPDVQASPGTGTRWKKRSALPIAGGVVGVAALGGVVFALLRRKRKRDAAASQAKVAPVPEASQP